MKKVLLILTVLFFNFFIFCKAQVFNGGFENMNFNGTTTNWGSLYLFAVMIDSNGVSHPDSIGFDGGFNVSSNDAHSGSRAMELRNAYNFTYNEGIAGRLNATQDSTFEGYNPFVFVNSSFQPTSLNFYYKYLSVNNDTGSVRLELYDSFGYMMGEADFLFIGTTSNYTLANVPVVYNTPGMIAYYSLTFCTTYYNQQGTFQASLGTRLLIDDVSFDNPTGIEKMDKQSMIRIFPNPSKDKLQVELKDSKSEFTVNVFNSSGQKIIGSSRKNILDISELKKGIYFVQVNSEGKSVVQKIIKQ